MRMRGKIHDQQTATRFEAQCRLAQGACRIFKEMQNLMQNDRIEALHFKWQRIDIALAKLGPQTSFSQLRPRDSEHCMACINTDETFSLPREQLQHAARAGAEIEKRAEMLATSRAPVQ